MTARSSPPWPAHYSLMLGLASIAASGCDGDQIAEPVALTGLEVTGARTSLTPPFDPNVYRYSVVADDSPEDVTFTPSAALPVVISVDGAITPSDTPRSVSTLAAGDVITIEVQARSRNAPKPTVYEIVYLPRDFPQLIVTTLTSEASPEPLYVNLNGPRSFYVAILDNHGVPLFYRADDQPVFDFKWYAATGERSYLRQTDTRNRWGRLDGEAVVLDAGFNEKERVRTTGLSHTDIHDFLITAGGEYVLIAYEGALRDLTALGLPSAELVEESIVQVLDRGTKQVLFQWGSWDEVPFEDQISFVLRGEYAHVNSVVTDPAGDLIVSARGASQVVKISRSGGHVLWKLGGKANQFLFRDDPFPHLCGQHSVTRLANGNLLIFDSGQGCWPVIPSRGNRTRVVEYSIDEQRLEATLVWSYEQAGAYSTAQGSAQRLQNGNTLIGWGIGPGILATEVNHRGEKVFEIVARDGTRPVVSYRASRYPH